MNKILKITGIVLLVPMVLFLAAAIIIPIFFKEDIKKALDKTAQKYINANINYDQNSLNISLFKDFPNVYFGIGNLSLVNQAPFAGDTLVSIQDFGISFDIKSVLTNNMQINGLTIDGARVFAHVNADGKSNWDIVKPDSSVADTTKSTPFALNIDHWEILNTYVEYDDKPMSLFASFDNLNHSGTGNIADIIKITTDTKADKAYLSFGGITYLNDVKLEAINNLSIEGDTYTLEENSIKLNDLALLFKGSTTVGDAISMDMALETNQTSFKNLISLIPSVFMEGYEKVEANGTFSLNGTLKGIYSETSYPAFDFKLLVKDGNLKYPDLPKEVEDININMSLVNQTGQLDNTTIDIKSLALKMGTNFINGRLLLKGLTNYYVDTDIKAKFNLAEITQFYPLEGTTLKGLIDMNVVGKGIVDLENNKFPTLNGYANLSNGFVKSADFNLPVENVNFKSTYVSNGTASGSMVDLTDISLLLDKDKFGGRVSVHDFEAINYKADLNGRIDLGKLMKIFPIDNTTLSGIINIQELKTSGNMKLIESENYAALKTSGKATVQNLIYKDKDYVPYGMKITNANIWFTPEKIMIDSYNGFVDKSDINIKGYLENYMGFMFGTTDTILGGKMAFGSKKFDSNIFFITEGVTEATPVEESVYIIPNNINFSLDSKIDELLYDDLNIKEFNGQIILKDGIAYMNQTQFKTLGASFTTSGNYNTTDPKHPKYDFKLNIKEMPIKEAYTYFNVVKALAPFASKLDGKFSTDMVMKGELKQDYMPDLTSLNMLGSLNVIEAIAKVTDIKMLSAINEKTKISGIKEYSIKDALMTLKVVNGKMTMSPFAMKNGNSIMQATLSQGIADNSIAHKIVLDVPTSLLKNGLGTLGLDPNTVSERMKLNFDVLGTSLNPKIILKNSAGSTIKDQVKNQISTKVDNAKAEAEARAKEALDKAKTEAEARARAEAEKLKAEAEARAKAEADKAKAAAKTKIEEELKNKGVKLPTGGGYKIPGVK